MGGLVIPPDALEFYLAAPRGLIDRDLGFLVGGAYALTHHAGIERHTRDLDLFVQRETLPAIERAARDTGSSARPGAPPAATASGLRR